MVRCLLRGMTFACCLILAGWAQSPRPAAAQDEATATDDAPARATADDDASASHPAAETYDLKYKFALGEVVRTEVIFQAKHHITMQGTQSINETKAKSIKAWRIKEVAPDGTVTFVHQLESVDMWQKAPERAAETYNSQTDSEAPPAYEDTARNVGVPLTTITMSERGKILKRIEHRPQAQSTSTQIAMPLPNVPVRVGQTWSAPLEIEVELKDKTHKRIQTREQFTLTQVVDGLATIDLDMQILTPIHDPAIEAELIQRLSKGTIRFDIATGRVVSRQVDLDRHVPGFAGPASTLHYVTRLTERLLPPGEETARRAAPRGEPVRAR